LVSKGLSNRAIAEKLGLTVGTVKVHMHAIFEKLDLHSRTELTSALTDRS
jgi:two-component system nitrate/nitrite response regulator NarP